MTTAMKSVIHLPPPYPVRIIFHPSRRRFFRSAPRNRTPVKRSGEMSQRFDIWALLKPNSFDYLADAITLRRSFARTPIGARARIGACRVQKTGHAARTYSCTTPPRRSRRRTQASPHSFAGATGERVEEGGARASAAVSADILHF